MTAAALNLSYRTEAYLSRLSLQAVNPQRSARASISDALNPCECGGVIAQLSHSRLRHIVQVVAGIATEQTCMRLALEISGYLQQFDWYRHIDCSNQSQTQKLAHIINFAICQLGGQIAKTTYKAAALGISASAYNQTWRDREDDIYRLLIQWAHDADYQLNQLLK